MTIDEFLVKLRETTGPWNVTNGRLRCGEACPLAAVLGFPHNVWVEHMATDLGLSEDDAAALVDAADQPDTEYHVTLRRRLLAATVNREQPSRAPAR